MKYKYSNEKIKKFFKIYSKLKYLLLLKENFWESLSKKDKKEIENILENRNSNLNRIKKYPKNYLLNIKL